MIWYRVKLFIRLGPIFVLICEDIISWMHRFYVAVEKLNLLWIFFVGISLVRASNEYHQIWANLNSNDATVDEYPYPLYGFVFVLKWLINVLMFKLFLDYQLSYSENLQSILVTSKKFQLLCHNFMCKKVDGFDIFRSFIN